MTQSKAPSAYGRLSTVATVATRPRAAASSTIAGERSTTSTFRPSATRRAARAPSPQPTSSTRYGPASRTRGARAGRPTDVAPGGREKDEALTKASFVLERIDLMAPYPDGAWCERDFYTLDRAVAEG